MAKGFEKLTRPDIRKLSSGEKITEHGICFERLRNGDGVFTVNIMVDGQRIHRVVGRESDGTTRTQAEEYICKLRNDAKNNRLSLPKGRKTFLSFGEAAEKYLMRLKEEGGKDLEKKCARLQQHLIPFFGKMNLSGISTFDVERYKKKRLEEKSIRWGEDETIGKQACIKKISPATVNRELAVLSHLLSMALEWKWITHTPVKIKRMKEESGRITYLTKEQIKNLVDAAKVDGNAQIYPFIVIGLATCMRRMEILSIRKEHINLEQRTIYIPKAKAGARQQPITAELVGFLNAYIVALPKDEVWLFPSSDAKDGHTVDIRKPFRRVVCAAGLDPDQVVRHTLRHTAITHLVQAGVDLPTVKRISGHKTLAMVERYSHTNGAHIEAAMDKLEGRIKLVY